VTFPDVKYDLETHAVKYYAFVAGTSNDEFEREWYNAREYVSKRLSGWDAGDDLDDMEIQGVQTVVFGFEMMRSFAEEVGADLSKLPSQEDLDDALRYVADIDGMGRQTHTDQFLQLLQRAYAADDEYVEPHQHYTTVRKGEPGEELRINVRRAYDAISKYCKDYDLSEDLLGSGRDYQGRFAEMAERDESYVTCASQPSPPIGRAVGFDTDAITDAVEEFDVGLFVRGEITGDFTATADENIDEAVAADGDIENTGESNADSLGTNEKTVTTDGGGASQKERQEEIKRLLAADAGNPVHRSKTVSELAAGVADEIGADPSKVEHDISALVEQGDLITEETEDGQEVRLA